MKMECDIVKDLLPLYVEQLAGEASKIAVEEHLEECESCKEIYREMKTPEPHVKYDREPAESFRRYVKKSKGKYGLKVAVSTAAVVLVGELILLLVLFLLSRFMDPGLDLSWFHTPVILWVVCAMTLLMVTITGLLPDFLRSFAYSLKKQEKIADIRLKRSLLSVKLAMITAITTQLFATVFNYVSLLTSVHSDDAAVMSAGLTVLAGSSVYGILVVLILLPVYARLKIRLISLGE